MELKISDGRYVSASGGGLETVGGGDELFQRAVMRLKTPKGSFLPCPDYGSELHTLCTMKPSLREAAARQFVYEALAAENGISVKSVEYSPTQGGGMVSIELSAGAETAANITLEA